MSSSRIVLCRTYIGVQCLGWSGSGEETNCRSSRNRLKGHQAHSLWKTSEHCDTVNNTVPTVYCTTPRDCYPTPFSLSWQYISQWRTVKHQISEEKMQSSKLNSLLMCSRWKGDVQVLTLQGDHNLILAPHNKSARECMKSWVLKCFFLLY